MRLLFYSKRRQVEELQDKISKTRNKSNLESLKKSLAEVEKEAKDAEQKLADVDKEERVRAKKKARSFLNGFFPLHFYSRSRRHKDFIYFNCQM